MAEESGQTVHIYYDEQSQEYEAFRLYSERKDDPKKDEPMEEWLLRSSAVIFESGKVSDGKVPGSNKFQRWHASEILARCSPRFLLHKEPESILNMLAQRW